MMRRVNAIALRGLLLALVAVCATGGRSHARTVPGPDDTTATAPADAPPHDHIDRRIEQPLPFLAGNDPLETILEINSRVSTRTARRSSPVVDDGSDGRPATLSRLRLRLASWRRASAEPPVAFASNGSLHSFSTPPPVLSS